MRSPRSVRPATSSARQHTQARYTTEFYEPDGQRLAELGDLDRGRPARRLGPAPTLSPATFLANYEPPPIDDAIDAELRDFVDRRISEGGVPTDF